MLTPHTEDSVGLLVSALSAGMSNPKSYFLHF